MGQSPRESGCQGEALPGESQLGGSFLARGGIAHLFCDREMVAGVPESVKTVSDLRVSGRAVVRYGCWWCHGTKVFPPLAPAQERGQVYGWGNHLLRWQGRTGCRQRRRTLCEARVPEGGGTRESTHVQAAGARPASPAHLQTIPVCAEDRQSGVNVPAGERGVFESSVLRLVWGRVSLPPAQGKQIAAQPCALCSS